MNADENNAWNYALLKVFERSRDYRVLDYIRPRNRKSEAPEWWPRLRHAVRLALEYREGDKTECVRWTLEKSFAVVVGNRRVKVELRPWDRERTVEDRAESLLDAIVDAETTAHKIAAFLRGSDESGRKSVYV